MITPLILDGKTLSKTIEAQLKIRVDRYRERCAGEVPTLATILVGGDPSSATYVKMKGSACARVGMGSRRIHLGDATTTAELIDAIDTLNEDRQIQGILLQHPVPSQINERIAFDRIAPEKDVDGVTCLGFGRMAMNEPAFGSATPSGIIRLMQHYGIAIEGKRAVVVGRSAILGKPMALMLLNLNATVTICHSRTTESLTLFGKPISSSAQLVNRNSSVGSGSGRGQPSSTPGTIPAASATSTWSRQFRIVPPIRLFRGASVP